MILKCQKLVAVLLCISLAFTLISFNTLKIKAENDEPSWWALDEVNEAIENELIPLHLQTDYQAPITRDDFCELVVYFIESYSDMGMPAFVPSKTLKVLDVSPFSDIDNANVNSANILGIANGYPDGTFKANNSIERQEASKMLTATAFALGYKTDGSDPTYFTDQATISSWAKTYVNYVYDLGIMNGVGQNAFNPHGTYQRQMAYMTINRLYKALPKAQMAEYPPQDPGQYYSYGLANAGPYTLNYTYRVNDSDAIDSTYYNDGQGNGRENQWVINYLDAEFMLHKYTKDDRVYITLPEKEYMVSYLSDSNSTIMTKIYAALKGEFTAASIKNGEYIYEYRIPFVQSPDMYTSYKFYSKNGEFYKFQEEFRNEVTSYMFDPIDFGPVSEDLFTLPTDYQSSLYDYQDDNEHAPFWWEMTHNE